MSKELVLKEKLFPVKNPAIIQVYGRFDHELEKRVEKQVDKALRQHERPDGLILLINSNGGSTRTLTKFINGLLKLRLPCMGFVEDSALSCGAELLLSCQYRVASPFAKICFHHGYSDLDVAKILDTEVLSFIAKNHISQENSYLERFCQVTGQEMKDARVIYRADDLTPAPRAVELGILHETTDILYPHSPDMYEKEKD